MAEASNLDEAAVAEQLRETEKSIADLQKRRAELLRAQGAIRWAKTKGASNTPGIVQQQSTQPVAKNALALVVTKSLDKALSSLEWSSFKKKEGEWTFLRNRDGSLVDSLASETDFVNELKKGRQLVVGKYRYVVSEDKFLNRYFEA
ncbi:MAG TPA: hypothetical protein VLY65_01025 [Nitrososphaerales archaeon]|nr:hypothetical protein [Nitrososphaerales archaeon]